MKSPSSNTTLSRGAIFVSPRDFVASSPVATMTPYSYRFRRSSKFSRYPLFNSNTPGSFQMSQLAHQESRAFSTCAAGSPSLDDPMKI
jgi:hypothetical protein